MVGVVKKRPGKPRIDVPNPVDVLVGAKVRERRMLVGLSQEKLGQALDLTFQQIQKYERGTNRISASKLHQISGVLKVPVSYFFEETPTSGERDAAAPGSDDPIWRRETLELVRAYYRIRDDRVRRRIYDLVKQLANDNEG